MLSQPGQTFIGRQLEMETLITPLDSAFAGRGKMVALAGEPGIGKTRTAQEFARHAQDQGVQVLWGWCYEGEGAPSYWPWVDSLRTYFQGSEAQFLRDQLGAGAAPISEMIPEVLEVLGGVEPAPAMEPDQARFRLFDAITGFFRKASEDNPILLVIDDLHWADRPSLLLLEFVARQLEGSKIMVVGAYRDSEAPPESPLGDSLGRLARMPSFQRQQITGLPPEDALDFVREETGVTPHDQLQDAIYAHTEGNPFFLGEVVRYLAELGRLEQVPIEPVGLADVAGLGIPQGIRDVIGQRILRLTEACNQALTIASVIGREFDFGLLSALSETASAEELLDSLDEARSARIIEDLPGRTVRYQFRHALMQQTLSETISSGRKVGLHARIGEALEQAYGDDPGEHTAELAHHFTQAVPVSGIEQMLRYTLMAGERALATYAHEEAVEHFTRGLVAKGVETNRPEPAIDSDAAGLLFGLARAQSALFPFRPGLVYEAVANLRSAFEYHVAAGDNERALYIAQSAPRIPVGMRGGLTDVMATALEIAPNGSPAKGQILANQGWLAGIEEIDYPAAVTAFDEATEIARGSGDGTLLHRTLALAAQVDYYHERFHDAVDKTKQVLSTPTSDLDLATECAARYVNCMSTHAIGEPVEQEELAAFLAVAERLGNRLWLHFALWELEIDARNRGDWSRARQFGQQGLSVAPGAPTLLSTMPQTEAETGEFDRAEELLQQLMAPLAQNPVDPLFNYSAALMVAGSNSWLANVERAPALPDRFAEIVQSSPYSIPLFTLAMNVGLAFDAMVRGDKDECQKTYEALSSLSGTYFSIISIDRLLGQLAHVLGNLSKAGEHFEASLALCSKAGYRPQYAWTCWGLAGVLLETGDRRRAGELLQEALQISTDLGMPPLEQRVEALLSSMGDAGGPNYPDGLTQREVEVLRLVALGKTDREIGEELFISVRTVSSHVGNILNKIGAANRTEAATYAASQDLGEA